MPTLSLFGPILEHGAVGDRYSLSRIVPARTQPDNKHQPGELAVLAFVPPSFASNPGRHESLEYLIVRKLARMNKSLLVFGSVIAVLTVQTQALAQVNVEPIRQRLKATGRTVHIRSSVAGYQGNTNGLVFSGGTLLGLSSDLHLAYLNASVDYARSNEQTTVAKAFAHLRYTRRFTPTWLGEAFVQWEHDRFRRINTRELFGLGPRVELFDGEVFSLAGGTAYMLEQTSRRDEDASTAASEWKHRSSTYATLTYRPHNHIALSETFYYQVSFADVKDYVLLSIFGAHFTVTPVLSSGVDVRVRTESAAPPGVEPTDLEVLSSLNLTF